MSASPTQQVTNANTHASATGYHNKSSKIIYYITLALHYGRVYHNEQAMNQPPLPSSMQVCCPTSRELGDVFSAW